MPRWCARQAGASVRGGRHDRQIVVIALFAVTRGATLTTDHAPGHPQPAVHRSRGAEGRRAAGRQAAQAARPDAGGGPALSFADGVDRTGARARRQLGAAGPQRDPRPDAVRSPRKPFGPRADADLRLGRRRQHHQPHLFQQSRLGEAQLAAGPEADGFGQARGLWRRMADHPSRGDRARQGAAAGAARAGLSADRGPDQPAARRACGGGARARARAARMDRAEPGRARMLARLAGVARRSASRAGRCGRAAAPRL